MTAPGTARPGLSGERHLFLSEASAAVAAVEAARCLGVLDRLVAGPTDPGALARDCELGERGARALLSALAGLGLVEAGADGAYRAAPDLSGLIALPPWERLVEGLRGRPPEVAGDTPEGAATLYPEVVPLIGSLCAPVAELAADHLAGQGLRVLDVGAGAAPWSIAIAARDRACQVTAVDLPAVVPAARRAVSAAGLDGQFRFLEGDLFAIEWGQGAYDLAIAGNLCHLFDEAGNRRLLGWLFRALRPGGRLAILDALPNERLDGPRVVVLYALGLLLRTVRGQVYPFSAYAGWLRDAGYEAVERIDFSATPMLSLIVARRPV